MSKSNLIQECRREFDNCNYTAASHLIWLRFKRLVRACFIVIPIICGSLASWQLLTKSDNPGLRLVATVAALLGGLMPSIYAALKYDDELAKLQSCAGEFTNLRDRFRQCAIFATSKSFKDAEIEFNKLMERLDNTRSHSLTAPEWCFRRAQKKVARGDYSFDVDEVSDGEVGK